MVIFPNCDFCWTISRQIKDKVNMEKYHFDVLFYIVTYYLTEKSKKEGMHKLIEDPDLSSALNWDALFLIYSDKFPFFRICGTIYSDIYLLSEFWIRCWKKILISHFIHSMNNEMRLGFLSQKFWHRSWNIQNIKCSSHYDQ